MSTSPRLDGKVCLITGAAAGLGAACAQRFTADGARVVACDVNGAGLDGTTSALALGMDVSIEADWNRILDAIVAKFGRLDTLVNNAAIVFPAAPVQETSNEDFERLMAVNVRSVFLGMKLAFPHLRETQGSVLNISSMAGVQGQANHAIYSATKGAINSLTKSTACDWGPHGVRVNALCPSSVWTEAMRKWSEEQTEIADLDAYFARLHPIGYCAQGEEIASVASFLCSDDARYVTGAIMPASGGSECGYRA